LGTIVGGLLIAIFTKAIPTMMSEMMAGMMENMMTQMEANGCNPEEM